MIIEYIENNCNKHYFQLENKVVENLFNKEIY